jgi:hypothetical protein
MTKRHLFRPYILRPKLNQDICKHNEKVFKQTTEVGVFTLRACMICKKKWYIDFKKYEFIK